MNELIEKAIGNWHEENHFYFGFGDFRDSNDYDSNKIYRMIFRRLHAQGADWLYSPPELFMLSSQEFATAENEEEGVDGIGNSLPASKKDVAEEIRAFREDLELTNKELRKCLASSPPPPTVAAYQKIFGRNPRGWPPA